MLWTDDAEHQVRYSSGENYAWLEKEKITGYIPVHGLFQKEREGFVYDQQSDSFSCPEGKRLTMTRHFVDREYYWKKTYRASRKDCTTCPVREACLGKKAREKKLDLTCFHTHYQRAYLRQTSKKGEYMKKLRQSRVEPVLGTLINFLALRRINTRGQASAHKGMLLSAMAFNLRKLLRWNRKTDLAAVKALNEPLPLLFLASVLPASPFPSADWHRRKNKAAPLRPSFIHAALCNSDRCQVMPAADFAFMKKFTGRDGLPFND